MALLPAEVELYDIDNDLIKAVGAEEEARLMQVCECVGVCEYVFACAC